MARIMKKSGCHRSVETSCTRLDIFKISRAQKSVCAMLLPKSSSDPFRGVFSSLVIEQNSFAVNSWKSGCVCLCGLRSISRKVSICGTSVAIVADWFGCLIFKVTFFRTYLSKNIVYAYVLRLICERFVFSNLCCNG